MNDMLREILETDKKARERQQKLEEYRREAIASLSARKEEIYREETEKARESAIRHSNKRRAEGEKNLAAVNERNKEIIKNMDTLYKAEGKNWVDSIVKRVTSV